jgi:two-component system, cell cycle sensor histidine kinase and response regulator CckA
VKQSGGAIAVESAPGAGTTFRIWLPCRPAGEDAARLALAAQPRVTRETLLLVEDSQPVRDLAARVLRRRGYTVLEAEDGVAALRVHRSFQNRIDLLVTDLVMPGMSGYEVAERLRQLRPDLPVLFMSGFTEAEAELDGVRDGDQPVLKKPFAPADLAAMVRETLDREQVTAR